MLGSAASMVAFSLPLAVFSWVEIGDVLVHRHQVLVDLVPIVFAHFQEARLGVGDLFVSASDCAALILSVASRLASVTLLLASVRAWSALCCSSDAFSQATEESASDAAKQAVTVVMRIMMPPVRVTGTAASKHHAGPKLQVNCDLWFPSEAERLERGNEACATARPASASLTLRTTNNKDAAAPNK